ncbi:hypothetical protein Cflav_PD1107 [Pedosphaera parvula Ellin514]|uniref:Outer membrane protein beta-barrel domain-containing protein n=2 Tax=Pedosphaera TaxID=1032526 RepID=B9XQA8_PEDPL|nr:hypothetical protein Cflav_PD1107 [Pedosphaera parvula Ellin514]
MVFNFVRLAIVIVLGVFSVAAAQAQGQIPDTEDWNFRLGIPIWAAGTHGTIGAFNRKVHLDQSFIDTLDSLDFAAALNLEVRKDRWLFFSDGQYLKISDTGESRELFRGGSASLGEKFMIDDLAIGYTALKNECVSLDLFAGAQLSYAAANVSINLPTLDRAASASAFWADPIIGAYLNYQFSKPAGFYTKADVGGFHSSSRLTWQVEGGFEFPIASHFYTRVAYRCLASDFQRRALSIDTVVRGPQVEIGVRF